MRFIFYAAIIIFGAALGSLAFFFLIAYYLAYGS